MAFYRLMWPNQTVTPKLHLLEDHAVNFLLKWGSCFGIYGEQGAESLHATFNSLRVNYGSMYPSTRRLKAMLNEHYMRVNPDSASFRPLKKMKRRNKLSFYIIWYIILRIFFFILLLIYGSMSSTGHYIDWLFILPFDWILLINWKKTYFHRGNFLKSKDNTQYTISVTQNNSKTLLSIVFLTFSKGGKKP